VGEVFRTALRLGLTSFGGPVAHLGYFRQEYVARRGWLDEEQFGELVALTNLLPGPSSSQLGIAIGTQRAGKLGGLAAWVGFTLPSALALTAVALWARNVDLARAGWVHGLELAAAAVVATAVVAMARTLARGRGRALLAVAAAAVALLVPGSTGQIVTILAAALVGAVAFRGSVRPLPLTMRFPIGRHLSVAAAALFVALLLGLPFAAAASGWHVLELSHAFYRAGALVFGGGHVVLPLLQNELVAPGLVDRDLFLAGYGATQAVPGPLFSFAFYAGDVLRVWPNGIAGGLLALGAIYLPSFLLVLGALPYWERLKTIPRLRGGLDIANAAVVGLLLAALCTPVFTSAVFSLLDLAVALTALAALTLRCPPWLAVIASAAVATGLSLI